MHLSVWSSGLIFWELRWEFPAESLGIEGVTRREAKILQVEPGHENPYKATQAQARPTPSFFARFSTLTAEVNTVIAVCNDLSARAMTLACMHSVPDNRHCQYKCMVFQKNMSLQTINKCQTSLAAFQKTTSRTEPDFCIHPVHPT